MLYIIRSRHEQASTYACEAFARKQAESQSLHSGGEWDVFKWIGTASMGGAVYIEPPEGGAEFLRQAYHDNKITCPEWRALDALYVNPDAGGAELLGAAKELDAKGCYFAAATFRARCEELHGTQAELAGGGRSPKGPGVTWDYSADAPSRVICNSCKIGAHDLCRQISNEPPCQCEHED